MPTLADDVSILSSGITVVNQQGSAAANSLMSCADLTINGSLTVAAGFTMMGGRLTVSGQLTLQAGASMQGADLTISGQAHLGSGSVLYTSSGTSQLGGATIDGDGKLVVNSGAAVFASAATISNLDFTGGALQGPGALTITGTMNWSGGNLAASAGTLNISNDAELNIAGYGSKTITSWTINVNANGKINWTEGIVGNTASTVNIIAGGLFNISGEGTWGDTLPGQSSINNAGTMTVNAGGVMGMPVSIEAALCSSTNLDVDSGVLSLFGGGDLEGLLDISGNASLILRNGIFMAQALAQVLNQGQGSLIIDGSTSQALTLMINAAPIFGIPSVSLQTVELRPGGLINGAGDLEIRGSVEWTGGTMFGPGKTVIAAGATMSIKANLVTNRTIENRGTTTLFSGHTLTMSPSGAVATRFDNFGELILRATVSIVPQFTPISEIWNNPGGLITKTDDGGGGMAGQARLGLDFHNFGVVNVDKGELWLFRCDSEYSPSSIVSISVGATFHISGVGESLIPGHVFQGGPNGGATISGAGDFIVDQWNFNMPPPLALWFGLNTSVSVGTFAFSGPDNHIYGGGAFSCQRFTWSGGSIEGGTSITVAVGRTMTIYAPASLLGDATITNSGTMHWRRMPLQIGDFTMSHNASITNDGTGGEGIFNIETTQNLLDATPEGQNGTIKIEARNGGVVSVEAGGGNNTIEANLVNIGGELNLNGRTLTQSRPVRNPPLPPWDYSPASGDTDLGGGELKIAGQYIQSGGTTTIDGGLLQATNVSLLGSSSLELGNGGRIDLSIGTACILSVGQDAFLTGSGVILGNLINSGMISISGGEIGASTVLFIFGNFTQMENGVLKLTVGGNTADTYDRLSVLGDVTLDGFLDVMLDNYNPGPGNTFDIIGFTGQRSGRFRQVRAVGNTINWTIDYSQANEVDLQS